MKSFTIILMTTLGGQMMLAASSCPVSGAQPASRGSNSSDARLRSWFDQATRNQLGSLGPPALDPLQTRGLTFGYPATDRMPFYIPASLIKAIGWLESHPAQRWGQFKEGYTLISVDPSGKSCGYGLMQITSDMTNPNAPFDRGRVAGEEAYNIGVGAQTLGRKWAIPQAIGSNDPRVYEHWYVAVWAYNGFGQYNITDYSNPTAPKTVTRTNNPNNPDYPFPFPSFDGNNSSQMPYQERIFSLIRDASRAGVRRSNDPNDYDPNNPRQTAPLWTQINVSSLPRGLFQSSRSIPQDYTPWKQVIHTDQGELAVVSSVTIDPPAPRDGYKLPASGAGLKFTAKFTVRNTGPSSITLNRLTLGGRRNGQCDEACPDFDFKDNVVISPNGEYQYTGTLVVKRSGTYNFFPAFRRPDGSWNTLFVMANTDVFSTATLVVGTAR